MPTPDRTSLAAIVSAAQALLEDDGLAGVTMSAVALQVGVRPPSLYKRVESREHLIQLVAEATLTALTDLLAGASTVKETLNCFRTFGHAHPAAFQLVMTPAAGIPTARAEFGAAASEPILRVVGALVGDDHALDAARMVTAFGTGFISMELNGSFQLGGDVETAWAFGVAHVVKALAAE